MGAGSRDYLVARDRNHCCDIAVKSRQAKTLWDMSKPTRRGPDLLDAKITPKCRRALSQQRRDMAAAKVTLPEPPWNSDMK